jgi:hypothetical protein
MAKNKKKSKTGLIVLLILCGIVLGVIAAIIGITLFNKAGGRTKETQSAAIQETVEATETDGDIFDDTTPDDPIPTDEMNIAVIKVNDREVLMKEVNVYLYQLRDFYTAQYGESPWNNEMEDGRKLYEYAKDELYNGLVRTEILDSKAETYGVSLSEEELQQCADDASSYIENLGTAIAKDFALTEEGVRIMNEKQTLSTKVYNAALDSIAETAEDTSDEALAKAFEEMYEEWKSEYTITTDPIWENIVIGSVG